jgi:hypothetical protein
MKLFLLSFTLYWCLECSANEQNFDNPTVIHHFLETALKESVTEVALLHHIKSPFAHHYTFSQTYQGVPIYHHSIKLNVTNNGTILSVFDHRVNTNSWQLLVSSTNAQSIIYISNSQPLLAELYTNDGKEYIYNNGDLVYTEDLSRNYTDTTLRARVFMPNPIASARTVYGGNFIDSNDIDLPALNNQRVWVNIPARWENGSFFFENKWGSVDTLGAMGSYTNNTTKAKLDVGRGDKNFEGLNALYHVYTTQYYIQNLGFTNLANYSILLSPHALSADQSSFTWRGNTPIIKFGDGGVDDAEDAHVVVHEYHHGVIESASPGSSIGFERKALDEGSCDYFATSYSRSISDWNWSNVFSWDGHNEFWKGRDMASSKKYPNDMELNSIHRSGEIWGSCLMQLWEDIGRSKTDQLLYQAYYSTSTNITMPDMARLIIQADSMINDGVHRFFLCKRFNERGILNSGCYNAISNIETENIYIQNTESFMRGNGPALITSQELMSVNVYSFNGQLISHDEGMQVVISPTNLAAGCYIIQAETAKGSRSFKLIKVGN